MSNQQLATTSERNQVAKNIDLKVNELLQSSKELGAFERALKKTEIIAMISEALDTSGQLDSVMKMQGKQYGFKTDSKNPAGYDKEVVKNCLIEAVIRGVEPTGNMFNILGGNCYITKEGCKHILNNRMNVPFRLECALSSKLPSGITIVPVDIIWISPTTGKENRKHLDLPVTVFEGITKESAKKGQAERDAMAWLIEELTGTPMPTGDIGDEGNKIFDVTHEVVESSSAHVSDSSSTYVKKATTQQQEKFDKYIMKSTDVSSLEARATACLQSGLILEDFDLTVYNELKAKYSA